ncbi:MAG TPA: FtsX-like permease family protein [Candidatus Scybalousia intestinigallinarum]|nr:FtsX-like permease family protein [Candidatus Scybalousia intestinigallinarum]
MLIKESFISIKKNYKRYISLILIILLGVGFYAGIKASSPDMKDTLNHFYQQHNLYDFQLISKLGILEEDIAELQNAGYTVEAIYSFDTVIKKQEENAVKVYSYDKNSKINTLTLIEGKYPQQENECVIEKNETTEDFKIGDKLTVGQGNLNQKELTITGFIQSPIYISQEKDSTNLLSGKIDYYLYTPKENFTDDYYSILYVDLDNEKSIFSKSYDKKIQDEEKKLQEITNKRNTIRKEELLNPIRNQQNTLEQQYNTLKEQYENIENNPNISNEQKETLATTLESLENSKVELEDSIQTIEDSEWYILDITSNIGVYQYEQDTLRLSNIAEIFPLVFFVVAILVCLTTMTRMIEEQRSQIGTLKSLGYTSFTIMFKYIIYALSATLIGSIMGVTIGFKIIPNIIFNMYDVAYNIPDFQNSFQMDLAIQGTLIALVCTLGATIYTSIKTLKEVPAELLRPKAPKSGKRVLLEKIPLIWKRLHFSHKVTIRNVFRYKKKFLMTIIGISGSTALVLAGFGLKDCIERLVPDQYEHVFQYQATVTLTENATSEQKEQILTELENKEEITDILRVDQEGIQIDYNDTTQNVQVIIPDGNIENFIRLQNRESKEIYTLTSGVIITEKIANLLDKQIGDTISFEINKETYQEKITGITENYFNHYFYLPQIEAKEKDNYNTLFLKTINLTEKEEKDLATILKEIPGISSISFTSDSKDTFDSTMKNFSYVALILIVSAGLLAFIVLYNLESVNISERVRELASIKVLGFYDKEVYLYITRETIILFIIGIVIGLGLGNILVYYILKTCEQDIMMFNPIVAWPSYFYTLLIMIVFISIVSITSYFTLKKIDMIESLKSVE